LFFLTLGETLQHKPKKKKKTPPLESLDRDVAPKKNCDELSKIIHKTYKPIQIERAFKESSEFIVQTFT
jgi:hypothetical protein